MIAWFFQTLGPMAQLLLVSTALYLVSGLAVLRYAWPNTVRPLSLPERAGLAAGVSLALPPILLYLFRLIGLTWSSTATFLYVCVALGAWLAPGVVALIRGQTQMDWRHVGRRAWSLAPLAAITLLALVIRWYAVRDLRAGMFGDSVHHTLIVQLILENGGLFDSWQPYAPLASLTYHFGFHANTAFYAWLTGTPSTLSVLIVGQLLNALTAPVAYALVSRLLRFSDHDANAHFPIAPIAGLWTAALTAFASNMPFVYANWGRYTQLTGQVLLCVAVVAWIELIERAGDRELIHTNRDRRQLLPPIGLAALLTLGLMLTHYIVTIWTALFVAAYVAASLVRRASIVSVVSTLIPAAIAAVLALVPALPWIRNTLNSGLARNVASVSDGSMAAERISSYAALKAVSPTYVRGWMLLLAGAGVLMALAQRRWRMVMPAVWALLLMFSVTPQTLGLPGTGMIDQNTAYLALYIVVLPLAGFALAASHEWLMERLANFIPALTRFSQPVTSLAVVTAACLLMGVWGATWLPQTLERNNQMLTAADENAMAWINANLPADARFLVNTFPTYGGTLIAGTDAGGWIPLMTHRRVNLPPMTYGTERFERADFYTRTNGLTEALRGRPLPDWRPGLVNVTTPANVQRLRDDGIGYVFIGANGTPGPDAVDYIDTNALRTSDAFRLIYDQDGVLIFQLVK